MELKLCVQCSYYTIECLTYSFDHAIAAIINNESVCFMFFFTVLIAIDIYLVCMAISLNSAKIN